MIGTDRRNIKLDELLGFLPTLFRKGDMDTCLRKGNYSAQVLNRAIKKRFIARTTRGVYLNVLKCRFTDQWPSVEEVACYIKPVAYVSLEWALHYWDIILQRPAVCTAVVTRAGKLKKVRFMESYGATKVKYNIEYSVISNIPRHFGIEQMGVTKARIAAPERALLDWIHLRRPSEYLLNSWLEEMDIEGLDPKKLRGFASHYPSRVSRSANSVLQFL